MKRPEVSIMNSIWGGLIGASVGLVSGGMIGTASCSDCGLGSLERTFSGAVIGEALVMPLGVHYGNKRQGSLILDFWTSFAIAGGGLLVASQTDLDEFMLFAVPMVQIGSTVAVEHYTANP